MPFWISVWILSHWMRETTGPMVVPSARGSPALVLSATLLAMAATSFLFDSGTIILDCALQDWRELLNMCITPPVTALARSAPSRMTFGDLPPSSWLTRLTVGAARVGESPPAGVGAGELDGGGGALGDIDAGAGRAGEGDHVDVGMLAHGRTHFGAEAVDEVEHALRDAGLVQDFSENQCRRRREFARLQDHGAAGGERRRDL